MSERSVLGRGSLLATPHDKNHKHESSDVTYIWMKSMSEQRGEGCNVSGITTFSGDCGVTFMVCLQVVRVTFSGVYLSGVTLSDERDL